MQNTSESNLKDELWNARIEWPKGENRYFIPADDLQRLINSSSIETELRRSGAVIPPLELKIIIAKICEKALRLFATLVCQSMVNAILGFLEEELSDKDLPFVRAEVQPEGNSFKLRSHRRKDKSILCMAEWELGNIEFFSVSQWWMQAPIFSESRDVRHYSFEDNCVLPFIEDHEHYDVSEGAFSTVWAVKVHPAHQFIYKSTNCANPMIALKRLHSKKKEKFHAEVEMLKRFTNKHLHPHVVQLLATYYFQGRFYLMFPKARANLREYWEQTQTPEFSFEIVEWMLQQCKGIASGLAAIHIYDASLDENIAFEEPARNSNFIGADVIKTEIRIESSQQVKRKYLYGRHGDIKPENILISDEDFRDELDSASILGRLLIADFGHMKFHSEESRSPGNPEGFGGSPTYEPPDRALRLPTSRACDIWSLGCVFLEFITWLVSSYTELMRFAELRDLMAYDGVSDDTFFTVLLEEGKNKKSAIVRKSVTEWIQDLHTTPRCSQFVHDFLDLIAKEMLVVDPQGRIQCGLLTDKLNAMCLHAKSDPEYLLKPRPRLQRG